MTHSTASGGAAADGETAQGTGSAARLLRGGTVLTSDPQVADLLRGDVLIRDEKIAAVGEDLAVEPDVEIVDVSGAIVFPGLIDAHQHIWEGPYLLEYPEMGIGAYFAEFITTRSAEVTPEWLFDATRQALTTALRSCTTTTFDWCHAANSLEHAEAGLAAALEVGGRGLFGVGSPAENEPTDGHPEHLEDLVSRHGVQVSDRLAIAMALRGPDQTPISVAKADIGRARELGVAMSMHCGTSRFGKGGVSRLGFAGLMGPDLQFVHVTDTSPREFRKIARANARIVVPPISELSMGIGVPPLRALAKSGSSFGLGVDSVVGSPPDMFAQMRAAMVILRSGAWTGPWERSTPPRGSVTSEVLAAATIGGARACWLDDITGSLTPGKAADLLVMRPTRPVTTVEQAFGQVVWMGNGSRLESVLVDGQQMLEKAST
jgi:5-methylthioadenosine/S-adenosylhomocysteine deaminase